MVGGGGSGFSKVNSHKILIRIHCCCYYNYYYKDVPRGAHVSSSVQSTFLHSLAIALLETFLQILSLWMTKLRLRKASDDLPMLTPLQLLEPGFEPGSDQCL